MTKRNKKKKVTLYLSEKVYARFQRSCKSSASLTTNALMHLYSKGHISVDGFENI